MRVLQQRRWMIATFALFVLATGAAAEDDALDLPGRIDGLFADWNRTDAPGAAVAVIRDGRIVFQNAYGMADLERGVVLTPKSAFEIGSISKQFTAMCVLLLEHDGKLDLDDDIRVTIPEMPNYGKPITIRHLLHHTSGIRDVETLIPLAGLPWVNFQSPADQLELISRQKRLNFPPNSRFLYSNSGYVLLALIVERVSGRSLRDFARERIFEPLGMSHTEFWDDPRQLIPDRAIAYSTDDDGEWGMEMWNLPFAGPAGLYTTIGDLALWDANFYDNRLGGGEALITRMETPGVLDDGESTTYASGLEVRTQSGLQMIRHGGAWMGYRAFMQRLPEQRLSLIYLTNTPSIDVRPAAISSLVLAGEIDSEEDEAAAFEPPKTIELSPAELSSYEGEYWAESAELLRKIEVRDGSLHYVRGEGNSTELGAVAPASFYMLGIDVLVDIEFDVKREQSAEARRGRTMTVRIEGGEESVFNEVPPPSETDLSGLAGGYWSDELERELRLRVDDGRLLVAWMGDSEFVPAHPIHTDGFLVRRFVPVPWSPMDGRLRIERNDTGRVTGLTFDCEMVKGIVLTKRGS